MRAYVFHCADFHAAHPYCTVSCDELLKEFYENPAESLIPDRRSRTDDCGPHMRLYFPRYNGDLKYSFSLAYILVGFYSKIK
jgi:hypothetical protein